MACGYIQASAYLADAMVGKCNLALGTYIGSYWEYDIAVDSPYIPVTCPLCKNHLDIGCYQPASAQLMRSS